MDGGREKGKQLFGVRARSRQPDRPPVGPRPVRRRGTVITSLAERRLRGSETTEARARETTAAVRERERRPPEALVGLLPLLRSSFVTL